MPDAKYGEELMAWIQLRAGAEPLDARESLRTFCAGQLAHYKIPRYVRMVDEFPMTVTGKIRKVEMRERSSSSGPRGRGSGPARLASPHWSSGQTKVPFPTSLDAPRRPATAMNQWNLVVRAADRAAEVSAPG